MSGSRRALASWLSLVVIGIAPALLLGVAVLRYMLSHFFVHAPFLLDTGMLSGLAYRDGLLLTLPRIACDYADLYYDVYVSPLTSAFSVLSYLAPVGRIEWYAFIQSAIYVPIGLAVYLVASRLEPATGLRRLPITLAAALAFSFNGLVLWMIGFPHFEAAMPGLTCLVLGALVTGRIRTAWLCLALAASVRQDGGIHVAMAVAPLLFLHWRGVVMAPTRRQLILTIAVAVAISVTGMLCQRLFFHPFPRLTQAYLGHPLYSHLSMKLVAQRVSYFIDNNQVLYYPFLATCLLAALRRDARYLLGWAALLPWFAFSFLAVEDSKSTFFAYGVGPFIAGLFWVYLYGAHLVPPPRQLRAVALELVFALVCISSILGAQRAAPRGMKLLNQDILHPTRRDRDTVHAFVEALHDHRASLGQLRADGAVATLALEYLAPTEVWQPGTTGVDTVAFHTELYGETILSGLIDNRLDFCTYVRRTGLFLCSHDRLPAETFAGIPVDVVPAPFFLATLDSRSNVRFEPRGLVLPSSRNLEGWLGNLPRGTYEWTTSFTTDEPLALLGQELVRLDVLAGTRTVAFATASRGEHQLVLRFDADGGEVPLTYRLATRSDTPLAITRATLRRVPAEAARTP